MNNYFTILNGVNVQDKVEKKGGLSYLSWAYAWGEVKKRHPDAIYMTKNHNESRAKVESALADLGESKLAIYKSFGELANAIESIQQRPDY